MSIKQYYSLELILEAIDTSKEKFSKIPYMGGEAENQEAQLLIEGYLASLMREIMRSKSEFLDLENFKEKEPLKKTTKK